MKITDLYESEFLTDKDEILKWIRKSFEEFDSTKLKIESDGLIYDGHIDLTRDTYKLSVQFKEVTGYFDCSYTNMTNLEGCPQSVGDNFDCSVTNITSLKYCPQIVKYNFFCHNTKITNSKEYRYALYSDIIGVFESRNKEIDDIINTYGGSDNRKHWSRAINLLSKVKL